MAKVGDMLKLKQTLAYMFALPCAAWTAALATTYPLMYLIIVSTGLAIATPTMMIVGWHQLKQRENGLLARSNYENQALAQGDIKAGVYGRYQV